MWYSVFITLFIMLWFFRLRWEPVRRLYFHGVLFTVLYKVVLTFKSVDETLVCDHSNESYIEKYLDSILI